MKNLFVVLLCPALQAVRALAPQARPGLGSVALPAALLLGVCALVGPLSPALAAAPAVAQVISYNAGTGFAPKFTNAAALLG